MRNTVRSLSIAALAIGAVTCSDISGSHDPRAEIRASFAFAPSFDKGANTAAASLAQGGLTYDHVRVLLVRQPKDTLADTTVAFQPGDPAFALVLDVAAVADEELEATLQYLGGPTVLFEGKRKITARASSTGATDPVPITVVYIGPGATATKLVITPGAGTYASGIATQFTAKAFDAGNTALLNVPIGWSVSDASVATITAGGALTPKGLRGTVDVIASVGALSQSVTVRFAPPATGLRIVQGAAQTGSPGTQLPLPVIVELVAADGAPAPGSGLTATFVANTGGSATPGSVPVDPSGRAQAFLTLGGSAGSVYIYTVSVGGFSLLVPEIAVVGTPTQLNADGPTTFSMTAGIAPSPLPTFRVLDALGNFVPGVPLQVTIKQATGQQVASFPFLADTIGLVNVAAIVPTVAGTFTLTVTSGNPAVPLPTLTYTITVVPGAPAKIAFGQQPTNVVSGGVMSPAVTALIQDSFGNTVTSSTASVSVSLDPTTGAGVTLSGTLTVSPVNGVATFSTLKLSPAKSVVKLVATSGSFTVLSAAFSITP